MEFGVLSFMVPILFGGACYWIASKSRGKNARAAFRYWAWGWWLLLLVFIPFSIVPPLPVLDWINVAIRLTPAAVCFFLGVSSILKEIRAQQRSEYTDAA
jgi:hypothetical protein